MYLNRIKASPPSQRHVYECLRDAIDMITPRYTRAVENQFPAEVRRINQMPLETAADVNAWARAWLDLLDKMDRVNRKSNKMEKEDL